MKERITSMVILAGGKSSRMGSDKADLLLGEKTFLELQIEKGRALGMEEIVISGYHGTQEIEHLTVVKDRFPEKGPLGGLEAAFRTLKGKRCLVLGIDVVLVPLEDLNALMEISAASDEKAVILRHQEKEEPLIAVYDTDLADEMLAEFTERKGSAFAFLNRIGYGTYVTDSPDSCFSNINTPGEYERVRNTGV